MSVSRPTRLGDRLRRGARRLELTPDRAEIRSSALTDLVVITGFSGAGKSTAMAAFEDEGYFCVDNLPPEMIRSLAELFMHEGSKVERAAVVSDARGGSYFAGLVAVLTELQRAGVSNRVLFLEADEQTLLTRYQETRRRHPLSPGGSASCSRRCAPAPTS
jgi:RNase adapter protein RapZ